MLNKYYYDLHTHSCLSPCGDEDNTPNNIAGMASLCSLDIVALTDHNTCKNCPAFFEAVKKHGITAIAGMELTTSEDIHVVCLFEYLDDAMSFDRFVEKHRNLIKNRPDFFGEQHILDSEDNVIGNEEFLLSNATDISVDDAYSLVKKFGGVAYPAHIDRESNSITAVLGTIPEDSEFLFYELHDREKLEECSKKYGIEENKFVVSSDAHCLTDIKDKENFFLFDTENPTDEEIRRQLFRFLRGDVQ